MSVDVPIARKDTAQEAALLPISSQTSSESAMVSGDPHGVRCPQASLVGTHLEPCTCARLAGAHALSSSARSISCICRYVLCSTASKANSLFATVRIPV
ncbi:MAG: hypothetical protein IJU76_03820 [Desulfovibrionaceae bacterium]|nr:hypothetical protein [Desulfovibrionaceae bacterium]